MGLAPSVLTHWGTTTTFMGYLPIPRSRVFLGATSAILSLAECGEAQDIFTATADTVLGLPIPPPGWLRSQENIFNGATDGQVAADFKDAGHRLACLDTLLCVPVMVETSCVRSTRPSWATHANATR